jgi:hypothetical protein
MKMTPCHTVSHHPPAKNGAASIAGNAAVGWVAGSAAGKVMGAITGLSEPGQVALQRAGVLGGLLTSVIPKVFGSSNNNPYYG